MPVPNTNWQADFSYYLPRIDTIYLSRERKFGSNTGISSLNTTPPARLDGTMNLYTISIPAFTFQAKDVRAEYIENKRYTMRDIGKLEKRISNVEYYTSLSLLEKDAESLIIKDESNLLIKSFVAPKTMEILSVLTEIIKAIQLSLYLFF